MTLSNFLFTFRFKDYLFDRIVNTSRMVAMRDIFKQCQSGMQCHGKLLKELQKIHDKVQAKFVYCMQEFICKEFVFCLTNEYAFILFQSDIDNFWKDFKLFMMYSMIIQQRAPSVERTIDFIAKFVTMTTSSVPEPEDQNDSTMDDVTNNKLLQKMLDFLLEVCLLFFSRKCFLKVQILWIYSYHLSETIVIINFSLLVMSNVNTEWNLFSTLWQKLVWNEPL